MSVRSDASEADLRQTSVMDKRERRRRGEVQVLFPCKQSVGAALPLRLPVGHVFSYQPPGAVLLSGTASKNH